MAFVDNYYINTAVKGAAFGSVVRSDGNCVGKAGELETALVNAKGREIAEYHSGTFL